MVSDPIAYILWDHQQQLGICRKIESLIDDLFHPGYRRTGSAVLDYLTRDMVDHFADEHDLFDMLIGHFADDDGFRSIFALLREEHAKDERLIAPVVRDLTALVEGNELATPLNFLMNALALIETHRRHIAWENATVVPFATTYLTKEDIERLAHRMTARREGRAPVPNVAQPALD